MGNQGMTNWKFSAFLTIALMLVAGMFTTTAMAADGDGAVTVTATGVSAGAGTDINNLIAGSIVTLTFSYDIPAGDNQSTKRNEMDGGLIQLVLPAGWDYAADDHADLPDAAEANTGAATTGGTLMSGKKDKTIRIKLADDFTAAQTFTVTNIVVPIPNRLTDGDRSNRYEEYEFVASSRTRSGRLRKLDPIVERGDLDNDPQTPDTTRVTIRQARIRVGNIASARAGKIAITPDEVYETYSDPVEGPRRLTIRFTADGPMWNSNVEITFPGELDALDSNQLTHLKTASGSLTPTGNSGYFRLVNTGGSEVAFSTRTGKNTEVDDGAGDAATPTTVQVITIDVKSMDKDQGFEIIYESKIPSVATNTAGDSAFTAQADTRPGDTLVNIPAANIKGGKLRHKDGSGTMMVMPMYVEVDSGVKQFELRYTAATLLRNAELQIRIPAELLGTTAAPMKLQDVDTTTAAIIDGTILMSKIGTGDDKRNSSKAGYVYATDRRAESLTVGNSSGTLGDQITWNELTLSKDQQFRTIVRLATTGTAVQTEGATQGDILDESQTQPTGGRADTAADAVYPFYTTLDADSPTATRQLLEDKKDADLYAIRNQNVDVTFKAWKPADADDTTIGDDELVDHVTYPAASTQTITFRFVAVNTAIKGGTFSFRIPNGWTTPRIVDADNVKPGETTATIDVDGAGDTAAAAIKKEDITYGRTVTVKVDALPKGGFIDVVYADAVVQPNADTVDIIGEFKTTSSARARRAGRVEAEITNVADGSGMATISPSGSNATVRAGSTDNTITIVYTAAGTMNGGQVAFEIPTGWGDMQDDSANGNNHVAIRPGNGGTLDATNLAYIGRRIAVANLENFEKGDTVTFTYSNAEAPGDIGIGAFLVSSAGASPIDAGRDLVALAGETKIPDNSTDETLLGALYKGDGGKLRVKVISAADGTGEATVEIRNSSSPVGKYDDAADETREVHAGDTSVYLLFTYTPHETIEDGELEFIVPSNWTIPQEDDQGKAGYTYFEEVRSADIGAPKISGTSRTISVEIIYMTKDDSIQIHYGWHGVRAGGAEAPDGVDTDTFGFRIKGSAAGTLTNMRAAHPEVKVREAASGSGTATISPESLTASAMETVTITYTAAGEIENGALKLEVPEKWSDASSENITVTGGSGSANHGRQYYEADDDDGDGTKYEALPDNPTHVPGIRQVVYTGISLNAGGTVVFTYTTTVAPTTGDHVFKLGFKGGEGPNLDPKKPLDGYVNLPDLKVTVGEAAPGSGSVAVMHDAITASSTGNVITFTYTADGAIDYPGQFAVRVPTTWDADGPAAGDYTVEYQNEKGDPLSSTSQSVEEIAPKAQDMLAAIRGAASPTITAGHQIVFTYTSAAPATPGIYNFTVFYDDVQVGDPFGVLVLSAEEASMVSVSVADKLTAAGTAIPVTVNLLDADGVTAATRNTALDVTLSAAAAKDGAAAGMFSTDMGSTATFTSTLTLTFNPGDNEMMAYYKDASAAVATITATPVAASAIPADTAPVDTEVIEITSVSFTVNGETGMYAKADDTVMITVEATPKRTTPPVVAIGSVASLATTEKADMLGTYTAEWTVVVDRHEGTHTVTATLAGAEDGTASTQLTVDTADPMVKITAPAADMTVINGARVDITVEVTDGTKSSGISTVTADAKKVDTAQTDPITLSMSDGAYSGSFTISATNTTPDGPRAIEVTATDKAGNSSMETVMVTLDNTEPMISSVKVIDESDVELSNVKNGDMLIVSVEVQGADSVSADVSALNAEVGSVDLSDDDADGEYTGSVMVTAADNGKKTITVTAADDAASVEDTVTVTLDNTAPEVTEPGIDMKQLMVGGMATISATVTEASSVTVTADVSMLNATDATLTLEDADGSGMYSGMVTVTEEGNVEDIEIEITATDAAGNTGTASVAMVTLDNTPPEISDASPSPEDDTHVKDGDMVTISATVTDKSPVATVTADVSMLNTTDATLTLEDADGSGMYSGMVTVTEEGNVEDIEIEITATDAAGNAGTASVMVTLDNTAPVITDEAIDMLHVMAGDEATISATVTEASSVTVTADVTMLNAGAPELTLEDADGSDMYSGMVTVTADGNVEDIAIAITATDAAGNTGTASVMVTLDNTAPTVEASADKMYAKNGDTVMLTAMVDEAANVSAVVSQLDMTQLTVNLADDDGDLTYTGPVMISMDNTAEDGAKEVTVTATDAAGNSGTASVSVMLDNTVPEVTDVSGAPSPARNGHPVTISATVSEASTVLADVSNLDTMQTDMVALTDADGDGTYTGSFTISDDNEAENGIRQVTVTATDAAGNSGTETGTVDLINTVNYTSVLPAGISLFHVPLDVTAVDGSEASLSMVSDLYKALGDAVNYLITYDGTSWTSYLGGTSGDTAITADLGIVAVMKAEKTITFTGNAWGEDVGPSAGEGASMITLRAGLTLVGVPVNDASISTVGDLLSLPEFAGKVSSIIVSTDDGKFEVVSAAGGPAVRGDAAYLVTSSAAASQSVTGEGWSNGEMVGAAPIALFGHAVDNQTAALFVKGAIVDELTGLAKEGFRVKVKNLSTKAALSTISQSDVAQGGYNMTFVDTKVGNAARIGDVLEISADSPHPLIGVKPVRHIVTVDDVKNSRIELEDLIAYEIPAETELLRNYPNPFNPETWIPYHLAEDADVSLTIYDATGILVRTIDIGHQIAAKYDTRSKAIYWDGRNRFGEQVASGIYFYSLSAGDFSATRKMVILK